MRLVVSVWEMQTSVIGLNILNIYYLIKNSLFYAFALRTTMYTNALFLLSSFKVSGAHFQTFLFQSYSFCFTASTEQKTHVALL